MMRWSSLSRMRMAAPVDAGGARYLGRAAQPTRCTGRRHETSLSPRIPPVVRSGRRLSAMVGEGGAGELEIRWAACGLSGEIA